LRDYEEESRQYSRRCKVCGGAFVPDARHVTEDGALATCTPEDNLMYLEREYLKRQRSYNETPK
jgi:hypothetical protein